LQRDDGLQVRRDRNADALGTFDFNEIRIVARSFLNIRHAQETQGKARQGHPPVPPHIGEYDRIGVAK
jgi:hypothetical protein